MDDNLYMVSTTVRIRLEEIRQEDSIIKLESDTGIPVDIWASLLPKTKTRIIEEHLILLKKEANGQLSSYSIVDTHPPQILRSLEVKS